MPPLPHGPPSAESKARPPLSVSIAVLARDLDLYRDRIHSIFTAMDVPLAPPPGLLAEAPIVGFVLDVASLAPEFSYAGVLAGHQEQLFSPGGAGAVLGQDGCDGGDDHPRAGTFCAGDRRMAGRAARLARLRTRARGCGQPAREKPVTRNPGSTGAVAGQPARDSGGRKMLDRLLDLAAAVHDRGAGYAAILDGLECPRAACGQRRSFAPGSGPPRPGEPALAAGGLTPPYPPVAAIRGGPGGHAMSRRLRGVDWST